MEINDKRTARILVLVVLAAAWMTIAGCPAPEPAEQPENQEVAAANVPSGPYLGQPLPGDEPELFAPGIVSTGLY